MAFYLLWTSGWRFPQIRKIIKVSQEKVVGGGGGDLLKGVHFGGGGGG